jgi:hypothetical protein
MGGNQLSSVEVTLAILNERLEGIEGKLDSLIIAQERRNRDIEHRIRLVERWMYTVPASLITAITAAAITLLNNI